jgi:O-antigen ligase
MSHPLSAAAERRFEPVLVHSATPGRAAVRWTVVITLGLAPLAFGGLYAAAYIPLLTVAFLAGTYSLYRERQLRRDGVAVAPLPGERAWLVLAALVAFQLVPMPPWLLSILSPGSYSFHNDRLLVPLSAWKPITASPADTARGLAFVVGLGLLYRTVYREIDQPQWRRRLVYAVVAAGFLLTIEALVQRAYSANVIYGLYRPRYDWAVFGPYPNPNLFAGYMLMAVPLGIALCAESLDRLRHAWGRRRRRAWLALGDPEGSAFFRRVAIAMVLVIGLLATGSRGGLLGFAAAGAALLYAARKRRGMLVALVLVGAIGIGWIGLSEHRRGFITRGMQGRAEIWRDCARMVPPHLVFGAGFNAFGTSYLPYQTVWTSTWVGAAHNDYLQVLIDLGVAGAAAGGVLLFVLLRRAHRSAAQGAVHAGLFASLVAVLAHNLVDMNWQIAANAATFVALAGLAVQAPSSHHLDPTHGHA